jgi:hypothetical protein
MPDGTAATADPATAMLICQAITAARSVLRYTTERQLQDALDAVLAVNGYDYQREVHLGPVDRPDFTVGPIVIEVKVKGTADQLTRQIRRYMGHDQVGAVIVVTRCARHRDIPDQIDGKPVYLVWLSGLLG